MTAAKIRVLALTNMFPTANDPTYGTFVATQVASLEACGVEIQVEFIDGRANALRYATAIRTVRQLARSGAFDLVHAHYGLTGFVAMFQPLPLVVSFCGDDLLGTPTDRGQITMKSRVIRRMSHIVARRAEAIICKSEGLRESLPRASDRSRASVIPNGVDISQFRPGPKETARFRLNLTQSQHLILFPNTPTEHRKRIDLANAAVCRLQARGIAARLMIVQHVPPEQMPDHYRAADCVLLTSDWEGSPNVVKEALCCDIPVVSVDAGDVRHWLRLVPGCALVERDPEAIAAGLERVLKKSESVSGQQVRDALALPKVAAKLLRVYEDVLHRAASVVARS